MSLFHNCKIRIKFKKWEEGINHNHKSFKVLNKDTSPLSRVSLMFVFLSHKIHTLCFLDSNSIHLNYPFLPFNFLKYLSHSLTCNYNVDTFYQLNGEINKLGHPLVVDYFQLLEKSNWLVMPYLISTVLITTYVNYKDTSVI